MSRRVEYTGVDLALLAVTGVIGGVVFTVTWSIYNLIEVAAGPIGARLASYGLWFIGAPLAASLVRKPSSALIGELLGALVETLIAPAGGVTNVIYGFVQGVASEAGYLMFGYKRWDAFSGALAGALAGIPCVVLDALLFGEVGGPVEMSLWVLAACISGAIYGAATSSAVLAVRR